MVLLYDQTSEPLGAGKFKSMWHGPYIVKRVLEKDASELEDYEGTTLKEPRNGIFIKKHYAYFSVEADILYIIVELHILLLVPL